MQVITIPTNYNNKLCAECSIHLKHAPTERIPESRLNRELILKTDDSSYPAIKVLFVSLTRMRLCDMIDCISMCSHAMRYYELIDWWVKEFPGDDLNTNLAVYYFKKLGYESEKLL